MSLTIEHKIWKKDFFGLKNVLALSDSKGQEVSFSSTILLAVWFGGCFFCCSNNELSQFYA